MINKFLGGREFLNFLISAGWIYFEKILTIVFNLFVSFTLARHLSPTGYGEFIFILTTSSFFSFVANFGLETLVVKDLVNKHEEEKLRIIKTQLCLRLASGLVATALTAAIYLLIYGLNGKYLYVMIASISLIFTSSIVFDGCFKALAKGKYLSVSRIVSISSCGFAKLYGVYQNYGMLYFITVTMIESFLYFILISCLFKLSCKKHKLLKGNIDNQYLKSLIKSAWPLAISSGFTFLYNRIDILMIEWLMSDIGVGLYAAGIKISEATAFVPITLIGAFFPYIMGRENKSIMKEYMQILISIVFLIGVITAIPISLFAEEIVSVIYGNNYSGAAPVLSISIWAMVASHIAVASTHWLIIEDLQIYRLYRGVMSLIVNVILNYFLIPKFGIIGAAYATIASQCIAAYFGYIFSKKTFGTFLIISHALIFKALFKRLGFGK